MSARHSAVPVSRRTLATAAVACSVCLGLTAPLALAATVSTDPLANQAHGELYEFAPSTGDGDVGGYLETLLEGSDEAIIVVITPGTDDVGLYPRIDPIVGETATATVNYPESFWPVITGNAQSFLGLPFLPSVPTYQDSAAVATAGNVAIMQANQGHDGTYVYTGYSQGAEALGDAAEQAKDELSSKDLILLVSDPRAPWGIKATVAQLPEFLATPVLKLIGVDNNGARDPEATDHGDAGGGSPEVVSVIVVGDPVANTQWVWYRPVSSLAVNLAGFLAIHSPGDGPYGQLDCADGEDSLILDDCRPTEYTSGNTTYQVFDTYHPLALLNAMLYDAAGLDYDKDDLAQWNAAADAFYPLKEPGESNAAGVPITRVESVVEPAAAVDEVAVDEVAVEELAMGATSDPRARYGAHTLTDGQGQAVVKEQSVETGKHQPADTGGQQEPIGQDQPAEQENPAEQEKPAEPQSEVQPAAEPQPESQSVTEVQVEPLSAEVTQSEEPSGAAQPATTETAAED